MGALDTVAHEIKHLSPSNMRMWLSSGAGSMVRAQNEAIMAGSMAQNAWRYCRECKL